MMKIEFTYKEVMDFIRLHTLFSKSVEERVDALVENGIIENNIPLEALKQTYNKYIRSNITYSRLIKNSFWEAVVKEICDSDIIIIDHSDLEIRGVCCEACSYIVFESQDDALFEICPVCLWQNDGTKGGQFSGCNHCTLDDYKRTDEFEARVRNGKLRYVPHSGQDDEKR
ncbi:CPCC family cysteine-rich protein [Kosakonia sp. 1610]|uniref:CPCC family cysteine-rich protein n=1 Tax=Kosakonia sp. 1610 TaxID=3156426 RepID=UPI003D23296F